MSRLKKDIQLTLLSRIPVMLLSFMSVVFLTRLLGPIGNGVYTFTYAVLNLFTTVIGFQLDSSLTVFLAREKASKGAVFSAIGALSILSLLTFGIIMTLLVFLIPHGSDWVLPEGQPVRFFFVFMILAFILRRVSTLMQSILRGSFKFKSYNAYLIAGQLMPTLVYGTLLFLSVSKTSPLAITESFKIILLVELSVACLGLILVASQKLISFSPGFRPWIGPVANLSWNSLLSSVGHYLNKRLDVWFVQFYRGTATLGQYGLATQIANFVSDAMSPFNQVLIPYVAEASPEQHSPIVQRTARLNMGMALVAALTIAGTSWFFIPLFFGHAFRDAIPATQILAIGIIFISQRLVFSGYFKAINRMEFAVKAAWSGVVITVIFDVLLIPMYGIAGASLATTLAYATTSTYLVLTAKRLLGFSFRDIFLVRKSDITWLLSRKTSDEHTL